MPIPQNAQAIWTFLTKAGFNDNAAAGILGNIEQESGGNPGESGGGLIQILSGNPGYTSSPSLAAQMAGILTYVKANGSISAINANASSPGAAALYFSNTYERPDAALANNANRQQSAQEVYEAAKSGKWPSSTDPDSGGSGDSTTGGLLGFPSEVTSFFGDAKTGLDSLLWLVNPASWLRIGSFFVATILLVLAIYIFVRANSDEPIMPKTLPIPVPV